MWQRKTVRRHDHKLAYVLLAPDRHTVAAQRKIKWLGTGAEIEGAEKRDAEGVEWGGEWGGGILLFRRDKASRCCDICM